MMESSLRKFGSSLKVPSVHELANQNLSSVPPRYVRDYNDHPISLLHKNSSSSSSSASSAKEIPVIDLQKLLTGDDLNLINLELEKLHLACKEWGFFQIVNHGVNTSVIEKVKKEIDGFFHMPKEEKEKFRQEDDDLEGFGQAFIQSEEQKLDWADMFYLIIQPSYLRKPRLLPKLPFLFREALEVYSNEVNGLAMKILIQLAKASGMELEDMTSLFLNGMQSMRMNHYPPCPQPELVTGLCPHSDPVGLTILLQVNDVEGLQVRKDGVWVPIIPLPNAFIVNVGDIIEIVTNGIYKSVEHRAAVNLDKERFSIATFHFPNIEGDFGPAPSLIIEDPSKFKRIYVVDYLKGLYSRELDGKSYLDAIRV